MSSLSAKLVLDDGQVCCPCCGYALRVGATIRLRARRDISQMPVDAPPATAEDDSDG